MSCSTAYLPAEMQNQIKRERVLRQLEADYRRMLRETKQELTKAERMAYVKARHQEIIEGFGTDELS